MDQSIAYDCIPLHFLIAKLNGYGFDSVRLLLISGFHSKRRTKIGPSYRSCHDIIRGVPKGFLQGSLLFNIFINIFFFIKKSEVGNFADDNALYSVRKNIDNVISELDTGLVGVMKWFKLTHLKLTLENYSLWLLEIKTKDFWISILMTFKQTKNTGKKIDNYLIFKKSIRKLCKRAQHCTNFILYLDLGSI